ncbi:MAG: hypothetical protein IT210_06940 [Armatimonadetes bacterium]|nr:hypothetical protein [Armatimonadota bacterium]
MKLLLASCLVIVSMALLLGCSSPKSEEAADAPKGSAPSGKAASVVVSGAPLGSVKAGDRAVCVICAVNEGTTQPEEVKATLDYKGKTYAFCNEEEKAEFISNPGKYTGGDPAAR